jgi:hypothetical protein
MHGKRERAIVLHLDGEDPPRAGHAFEVVFAAVGQRLAGADAEVADRAADEHLARSGEAADPCADVDREAADVVVGRNDLAPTRCHARPSTNDRVRQFAFPPGANRACHSCLALS